MRIRSPWLTALVLATLSLLAAMPAGALADDRGDRGHGRGGQHDRRGNDDHPGRGRVQRDRDRDRDQRGRPDQAQVRVRVADDDDRNDRGRGRRDDDRRGRADDAEIRIRISDDDGDDRGRVTVCHATGSDTHPFVVLTIAAPGARAHERHGDIVVNLDLDIDVDVIDFCTSREPGAGGLQPPASLAVVNTTATMARLTWTPSAEASSFLVLQATHPAGPFVPSAVLEMTSRAAWVGGLTPGTTYYFQVRAVNASGFQSGPSNLASGTTLS